MAASDCYHLTGLISNFVRAFLKFSRCFSHFDVFIANKKEGVPLLALRILAKKKIDPSQNQVCTIMLRLYYSAFLMSSYVLKMFLLTIFEKIIVLLLETSL